MHELSIAISLLEVAAEEAERRGIAVVAIHLKLGPLSGVIEEALRGAFELAKETSPFPNCRLEIEPSPIVVFCDVCNAERSPVSMQEIRCSVCGTPTPKIVSGREMLMTALEVAEPSPDSPPASA